MNVPSSVYIKTFNTREVGWYGGTCSMFSQQLDRLDMPFPCGPMHRRPSTIVLPFHVGPGLQQQLDRLDMPCPCGAMHPRPSIIVLRFHVGPGLQQQLDLRDTPSPGGAKIPRASITF